MQHTARAMRDSLFCVVPAGDTLTSRRLFDALAAGCVPLILRPSAWQLTQHLPFPHTIRWESIAVFMVASRLSGVEGLTAALLALCSAYRTPPVAPVRGARSSAAAAGPCTGDAVVGARVGALAAGQRSVTIMSPSSSVTLARVRHEIPAKTQSFGDAQQSALKLLSDAHPGEGPVVA